MVDTYIQPAEDERVRELLRLVQKMAARMCERVDGDECAFFVKDIGNFCPRCHAQVLLNDDLTDWRTSLGLLPVQPAWSPDAEAISAKVHEAWLQLKLQQGITSRKSELGEELMVPYEQLSEAAKEIDRMTVKTVCEAIETVQPAQLPEHLHSVCTFQLDAGDRFYSYWTATICEGLT